MTDQQKMPEAVEYLFTNFSNLRKQMILETVVSHDAKYRQGITPEELHAELGLSDAWTVAELEGHLRESFEAVEKTQVIETRFRQQRKTQGLIQQDPEWIPFIDVSVNQGGDLPKDNSPAHSAGYTATESKATRLARAVFSMDHSGKDKINPYAAFTMGPQA